MKFSLWTQYGALNSKPVFDAFAQGCKALGHTVSLNDNNSDVDVIWSVLFYGRMSQNRSVWQRNKASGKPTIVLEVGGIRRGETWKVGLNGINRDAYFGPSGNDDTRAKELEIVCKPWKDQGKYILICGQHDKSLQWQDMPTMSKWVMDTIDTVQKYSDRPIVFRPHPRCKLPTIEHQYKNVIRQEPQRVYGTYDSFDMRFNNIWATISWSSNPGIHSIIEGIPAYVGPSSLAYDAANNIDSLHTIENPHRPERQQWLNDYAWTEFTLNEIATGLPINRLTDKL